MLHKMSGRYFLLRLKHLNILTTHFLGHILQ